MHDEEVMRLASRVDGMLLSFLLRMGSFCRGGNALNFLGEFGAIFA